MVKIIVELRICTNIEKTHLFNNNLIENNNKRIQQYRKGILKFIELNKKYINNQDIDVYITDNTIQDNQTLSKHLLDIIPNNFKIITCFNNNYGCYNKGAGDIEQWLYCKKIIEEYDYFIHFEPRQLLIDNQFIDNFMKNPRTIFTYGSGKNHFNTGLFACKTQELLQFINIFSPKLLVEKHLGIEYAIYHFYNNKIPYDILDKMNLIWYPSNTNSLVDEFKINANGRLPENFQS